jgi:hypothetical protein
MKITSEIERLYQDVGSEALCIADDLEGKLLVYAEIEDGAISSCMLYEKGEQCIPTFKFCSPSLKEFLIALWERWNEIPENKEWRAVAYLISDGDFTIDFTYPEQLDADETLQQRRPNVFSRYFGDATIDYSNPSLD